MTNGGRRFAHRTWAAKPRRPACCRSIAAALVACAGRPCARAGLAGEAGPHQSASRRRIGDSAAALAEHITRTTGQQAVVENRTGVGGNLGMDAVAKAAPDGYTLGLALNGNLVINPFVLKSMPFDAMKDLIPVAAIGDAPQQIALSADVPAKTFKEFQALAKGKPGVFVYGSAGVGSLPHLSTAHFAHLAGIELTHVPYRGNAPAMTDLIAGRIHVLSGSIGTFRAALEAQRIRLLLTGRAAAALSARRADRGRGGPAGYLMSVWIGVVAPAGTPQPVIERVHAMTQSMMRDETARKALTNNGLDLMPMSQPEFAKLVREDHARSEKIVKDAGIESSDMTRSRGALPRRRRCGGRLPVCAFGLPSGLALARPRSAQSLFPATIAWDAKHAYAKCAGAIAGSVPWPGEPRAACAAMHMCANEAQLSQPQTARWRRP